MFKKTFVFSIIILIIALILYLGFNINSTTEISTTKNDVPYYFSEEFCVGIINDKNIFYVDFNFNNTKTLIYCYPNSSNMINDNFLNFSKNCYNITVTKTAKFDYDFYEKVINRLGGINILDKSGNEMFLLGNEVKKIFEDETDTLYLSYLLGEIIKSIFNNKIYDWLYQYSDISHIDIVNYEKSILMALQQIDCIN